MSMTQIWNDDRVLAVTPIQAGPCQVTQVKDKAKDGYQALQVAYGNRKEKNINKPQRGHVKALGLKPMHLREFRTEEAANFKAGDVISVATFAVGDKVKVTGTSKGKGFQGVVKRHGFGGFRATHGNKDQERMPGSIGPKGPAHVFKGTRMAGRMGGDRVTVSNLEIVKVDEENNLILVKGAVPGAINSLVMLQSEGELKVNQQAVAPVVEEAPVEEVKVEEAPVVEEAPAEEVKAEEAKTEETKTEETKTEEVAA